VTINLLSQVSAFTYLLPVSLVNKFVFSRLVKRPFHLSPADLIDLVIFGLSMIWLDKLITYQNQELEFPLFGEEVDSDEEIKLMLSIIHDIRDDTFHMDYLLAAITALLWFRCIMLLRLSEVFGPLIEMIFAMMVIFMQFTLLFALELIVFSSVAALTLTNLPDFTNIFESLRTYLEASLGEFNLHVYDDYEGVERWFGLFLHITVLFVNMILIINLLIAIMSDTYSRMSDKRIGLYWATVI